MKTKKLNQKELEATNGGASTTNGESGLAGDLGIGNLASFSSSSQNGDQSKSSNFSVGNGINTDLGEMLNKGAQNN